MPDFNPQDYGFHSEPKLYITYENGRFRIRDYGCDSVDMIHPGVYAWTIVENGMLTPKYIGLFGATATRPSLRQRFSQHLNGLNGSLRGAAPTKHWRDCLFPAVKELVIDKGARINIYFGHFERNEIEALEMNLIQKFQPEWNSRGL